MGAQDAPSRRARRAHRRPNTAIGGFQDHLRRLAGAGHHGGQPIDVIDDANGLETFACLGHPDQHRPPAMQIHTDELPTLVLFAHKGPPSRADATTVRIAHESTRSEARSYHIKPLRWVAFSGAMSLGRCSPIRSVLPARRACPGGAPPGFWPCSGWFGAEPEQAGADSPGA
jgi:hypothetical protein